MRLIEHLQVFKEIIALISKEDFNYLEDVFYYVLEKAPTDNTEEVVSKFKELVTEEQQEQVMTVADRLREEGKLEGIEQGIVRGLEEGKIEGKLEIAKNLLTKNLDEILIAETTGLTLAEIKKLKN